MFSNATGGSGDDRDLSLKLTHGLSSHLAMVGVQALRCCIQAGRYGPHTIRCALSEIKSANYPMPGCSQTERMSDSQRVRCDPHYEADAGGDLGWTAIGPALWCVALPRPRRRRNLHKYGHG